MSIALIATGAKDAELRSVNLPVLGYIELYPVPLAQAAVAVAILVLPDGGGKCVTMPSLATALAAMYVTFVGSQPSYDLRGSPTHIVPLASVFQALVVGALLLSPNLASEVSGRRRLKSKTQ